MKTMKEVDFIEGDTPETVHYRFCDICFASAVPDIQENREPRKFYFDETEGLSVCAECKPAYEEEQ